MSEAKSNGQSNDHSNNKAFASASRPEQRAAAAERRAAYPYRFPRDMRKMGGKFTVEENARRQLRYFLHRTPADARAGLMDAHHPGF